MCNRKTMVVCCFLLCLVASCQPAAYPEVGGYGAKVRFAAGHAIRFPDFTLTYLGRRHVASAALPRGFTYHDFQIDTAPESVTVAWSSGTGDIGPVTFTVAGRSYRLELQYADALGMLADDELVITPA